MKILRAGERPLIVGHRGGRGVGFPPENTLAAFDRARAEGAEAVETDLRLCDGEVVAFHDATLSRMTEERDARRVDEVALSELTALGVPTLDDVLDWAARAGCGLNLELKHDVPDRRRLARAVTSKLRGARAPLLVSSFDPYLLALVRVQDATIDCALLTDPGQAYAPALQLIARPPLLRGLHVERRQAEPGRIAAWKGRGLAVGVWTVNDLDEARALARDGVDLLITDQPARLVAGLRR